MPKFFYTAKSIEGETTSGVREAKDERELGRSLHQEGFVLMSANVDEGKKKGLNISINIPVFGNVSTVDKLMFTRNLEVMVGAGIPLPRAINILASQSRNKKFKTALLEISEKITQGNRLSESMEKYRNIFSEFFVNMIKVGEEAGTMEDVLKNLTLQMERDHQLRSRIKGAMVYPAVILTAMIIIGILMLVMVIPKLAEIFKELNVELPVTTKMVIALGSFLSKQWYLALLTVVVLVTAFKVFSRTKFGKRSLDSLSLKAPLISPLVRKMNAAYMTRTLGSLFASGVPIVRALEITANSLGNVFFKESLLSAGEKVAKGSKLGESLRPYESIYSSLVVQMIEIGEETGETSAILQKLADFFEEEVSESTKNLSSIIEPVLMIIVGIAVGFFAVSMFQPMYSMLGNV